MSNPAKEPAPSASSNTKQPPSSSKSRDKRDKDRDSKLVADMDKDPVQALTHTDVVELVNK